MSVGEERAAEAEDLVRQLRIHDTRVRAAMLRVPRHRFVPVEAATEAYEDEPVPLGSSGATSSAPHMAVLMLEAAGVTPGSRVLEVGAGMGYLVALLAELAAPGGRVDGVEIDAVLAAEGRRRLAAWGPRSEVRIHATDGSEGLPAAAPFDRILVSCQTPEILPRWREQLAFGGRIIAPVGDRFQQVLTTVERRPEGWHQLDGPSCRFVPLRRRLPRDI